MKNKTPSFAFLLFALTLLNSANPLLAQSVITGTLLGHDGKPMKKTMIIMTVGGPEETTIIIQADEKGGFRHQTYDKGLLFLNFVGVNHRQQQAVIYIDEPREIAFNVRLDLPDYKEELSLGELRGTTANASFNGLRFEKQPDGKFAAVFSSNETSVQYLIINATNSGEAVTGTNANEYYFNPHSGIITAVFAVEKPTDGKVTILLEPVKSMNQSKSKSPFINDKSFDAQFTSIYRDINSGNKAIPHDGVAIELLSKLISKEKNPMLRQALWIKYLNMVFPNPETGRSTPSDLIDAKIISKALDELTPTSPFWMLRWLFPDDYLQKAVLATGQPDRYKDYAERSIESWPYGIRGWGFSGLMKKAAEKEETAEADRLYNRLQELSPESPGGKFEKLQRERKAAAKVVAGTQVPAFKAHSLGDTSVVYTPDNMQAKIYLIDFWATWCAPCIQEFPYLQKAYDQFHNKGFEILSYSLDASREVVVRFRKERFPMP